MKWKPKMTKYNHENPHTEHFVIYFNEGKSTYKTFNSLEDLINNVNSETMFLGVNVGSEILELAFFGDDVVVSLLKYKEGSDNGKR